MERSLLEPTPRTSGHGQLKGAQCEVRVLMHLMIRALLNGYHSFHLINNKHEAGKFDDVLFLYRISETEPERLRLIQSKNTEGSLVTVKDLLETPNGNFDLTKYLNSYNKIRESPMFTGYEIQDLVLYTTRDIDKDLSFEFCGTTLTLAVWESEEDIFQFQSPRYKFVPSNDIQQTMPIQFMTRMAEKLIDHMVRKTKIKVDTFDPTEFSLLSYHVLSVRTKRKSKPVFFKTDFLVKDNVVLSAEAREFQKNFIERYEVDPTRRFSLINDDIEGGKLSLDVSKNVVEKLESSQDDPPSWPVSYLQDFVSRFIFAANQPNEDELKEKTKEYIEEYIAPFSKTTLTQRGIEAIYTELETYVSDEHKKKIGKWLTKEEALDRISQATGAHSSLICPAKSFKRRHSPDKTIEAKKMKIEWKDLKNDAQEHIRNLTVTFQGQDMPLKDLCTQSEMDFMSEFLIDFTNETVQIGRAAVDSLGYEEKSYISRSIQCPTIRPKIENFTTEKQFNESKGNAQLVDQKTGAMLKERREIYTTEEEFHKSEGNAVLVEEKTGIILQFKGELHTIEGWKLFSEEELLDFVRGAAIISDAAGSGKTTILTRFGHLLKRKKPSVWVERFDLSNLNVIEKIDKLSENMNNKDVEEFLETVANVDNDLTKKLFHQRLNGNWEIVIMMDGFDEISDKYHQKILKLLEKLIGCNKIHQLWICTRPHAVNILEKALNKKAFRLQPLHLENQIEFMTNYWNLKKIERGKPEARSLKAQKLIEKLRSSTCDYGIGFTVNPLQCRLLAEAFDESDLPESLDLKILYDRFWKRKIEIFQSEKNQLSPLTRNFDRQVEDTMKQAGKILQQLALKLLFPMKKELWKNFSNEDICSDWGMTVKNNRFLHSTFAEYFASNFFFEKIKKDQTFVDILIVSVFCDENFPFMRCFFNGLLSDATTYENMEKYCSVMDENNLEHIQKGILNCSIEGNGRIMNLIFSRVYKWKRPDNDEEGTQKLGIGEKILIENKDEIGSAPLHYASENGREEIVSLLLDFASKNSIEKEILQLLDDEYCTPLHLASENGSEKVVTLLLGSALKNGIEEDILKSKNCKGSTPLHSASENDHEKVVKLLLDSASRSSIEMDILKSLNYEGCTPLYLASESGYEQVVELILDCVAEKNIDKGFILNSDETGGCTPLHCAAENGHVKIVQLILDFADKNNIKSDFITIQDEYGNTPLHCAKEGCNEEVVDLILKFAKKRNIEEVLLKFLNNDGKSPLHYTSEDGSE